MSLTVQVMPLGPISANCYIITDTQEKVSAVIDPGACTEALLQAVEKLDVRYILLTHGHFDHILGACDLKTATGARLAVHQADAQCLLSEEKSLCSWELPGAQKPVQPDVLLAEGDTVEIGKSTLCVLHTPGHTKGSVCYIEKEQRLIFSGDTLFCLTAGRTDFPGGSEQELKASLQRLKALEGDYTVYTGHNRSTTLEFERSHNRYMRKM